MRLKFLSSPKKGIPVPNSKDYQRIFGILIDDSNIIIMYADAITNSFYIERVINKFAIEPFCSSNLAVITDEEYDAYHKFFEEQGAFKIE